MRLRTLPALTLLLALVAPVPVAAALLGEPSEYEDGAESLAELALSLDDAALATPECVEVWVTEACAPAATDGACVGSIVSASCAGVSAALDESASGDASASTVLCPLTCALAAAAAGADASDAPNLTAATELCLVGCSRHDARWTLESARADASSTCPIVACAPGGSVGFDTVGGAYAELLLACVFLPLDVGCGRLEATASADNATVTPTVPCVDVATPHALAVKPVLVEACATSSAYADTDGGVRTESHACGAVWRYPYWRSAEVCASRRSNLQP